MTGIMHGMVYSYRVRTLMGKVLASLWLRQYLYRQSDCQKVSDVSNVCSFQNFLSFSINLNSRTLFLRVVNYFMKKHIYKAMPSWGQPSDEFEFIFLGCFVELSWLYFGFGSDPNFFLQENIFVFLIFKLPYPNFFSFGISNLRPSIRDWGSGTLGFWTLTPFVYVWPVWSMYDMYYTMNCMVYC